jgi:PAS domain-containing protein
MNAESLFETQRKDGGSFKVTTHMIYPSIALGIIVFVDLYLVPGAVITPLCSLLMLGYMALRFRPLPLLIWVLALTAVSFFMLYTGTRHEEVTSGKILTVVIRAVTLLVGGIVAVNLSMYRTHLAGSYNQIVAVLEVIATPIIISDDTGTINYVNTKAAELLGIEMKKAPGLSYFSFIANQSEKGKTIQSYLDVFDNRQAPHEIGIRLRGASDKPMKATLMSLGEGKYRRLVTVISEENTNSTAAQLL